MAALMMIVDRPRVRMVMGRARNLTSGLTKAFTMPKMAPMNR